MYNIFIRLIFYRFSDGNDNRRTRGFIQNVTGEVHEKRSRHEIPKKGELLRVFDGDVIIIDGG